MGSIEDVSPGMHLSIAFHSSSWINLHRLQAIEVYSPDENRRVVPVLLCYITKKQVMFKQGYSKLMFIEDLAKTKIRVHNMVSFLGCLGVTENLSFLTSAKFLQFKY